MCYLFLFEGYFVVYVYVCQLIFFYFRIYGASEFGWWNWFKFAIIIVCFYLGLTKVLFAIRNGLPRPELSESILKFEYPCTNKILMAHI